MDQCKTKLNFALGEIDVLNRRLKETEVDFTQKCGEVEDRVAIELEEKISLATKCEGENRRLICCLLVTFFQKNWPLGVESKRLL